MQVSRLLAHIAGEPVAGKVRSQGLHSFFKATDHKVEFSASFVIILPATGSTVVFPLEIRCEQRPGAIITAIYE